MVNQGAISPLRTAHWTSCGKEFKPSFSMIFARCVSTVLTAIPSSAAVCLWDLPAPSRRMICCSRCVSFRADNSAAGTSGAASAVSKNPFRTISATLLEQSLQGVATEAEYRLIRPDRSLRLVHLYSVPISCWVRCAIHQPEKV